MKPMCKTRESAMKAKKTILEFVNKKSIKSKPNLVKKNKHTKAHDWRDRYELDFSILDTLLYENNDIGKEKKLGRPTMYTVHDTVSGMIVGTLISMNPPCLLEARSVIKKAKLINGIGNIYSDSGVSEEFLNKNNLRSPTHKITSKMTFLKGLVERHFSVINDNLARTSNFKGDYRSKTMMTLPELKKLIENSVVNYNEELKKQ